jgi:arylsulfatase A-like enzyme
MWRAGPRSPGFQHENCLLELTNHAEGLIDGHARSGSEVPFFLYFPMPSPHTPHAPRAPFQGVTQAGPYGDLVVEHDWSIGRLLAALDRNGLTENTIVIMSSDNGAHTSPMNLETSCGHRSNYHFRGQKSDAWDGGHRIPLIIRWPGHIQPGSESASLLVLNDMVPLAARAAGVSIPAGAAEDAVDPTPLFANPQAQIREIAVHHSINGSFAVRKNSWKLIGCKGSGGWTTSEEQAQNMPGLQLYNLDDDIGETTNLISAYPDKVRELAAALHAQGGPALLEN